jgi:hypothetical protein
MVQYENRHHADRCRSISHYEGQFNTEIQHFRLHDNIAYSIFVSIVIVVVTMVTVAYLKMREKPPEAAFTVWWVTGIVIFLTMNFVLTLLMILKRIYIMLNQTIDKPFIRKIA